MKPMKKTLYFALIASEASHIFCCVLPTIFSVVSLLAGLGMVGAVPLWMQGAHEALHTWEVPIILFSGAVILIGWAVHIHSNKIDCHDHGCAHGPCGPSKAKSSIILKVATVLFLINVLVYGALHRGLRVMQPENIIEHPLGVDHNAPNSGIHDH